MITKKELTGEKLKKSLELHRAAYRWHNKNKSGGNFGINLDTSANWQELHFELTGYYNAQGQVIGLSFGKQFQATPKIQDVHLLDYDGLIEICKRRMEALQQFAAIGV